EGFVYIRDRVKDMIVSGGENVYPVEVEAVLAEHPDVADVAVIGIPDQRWGATVKAVVVRRPGTAVAEADLIDFGRSRLAGDQRLYVVSGSINFRADATGDDVRLDPGEGIRIPARVEHTAVVGEDGVQCVEGFEEEPR